MKKRVVAILVCACLLMLSACSAQQDEAKEQQKNIISTTAHTEPAIDISKTLDPIKPKLDEICRNYEAVGVQVAILKDGDVYGTYEYGVAIKNDEVPVVQDTKFRVASLSKLVTDIIFMRLAEDGKVSLDGDISDYLGFKVRNPRYPQSVITPSMLMSHTSSIIDSQQFLNSRLNGSDQKLQTLLESRTSFSSAEPGTDYSYSNFSIAVIGCICEKVTGKNFNELADEYIFDKLNIDASYTATNIENQCLVAELYGQGGYTIQQQMNERFCPELGQTHHLVQGNLTISAKDYITIASVLCNGGKAAGGTQILSKKSVAEMLADPIGYGFERNYNVIDSKEFLFHTGCNFGMFSGYVIEPETGFGISVLTSGAPGTKDPDSYIYEIILDIIRETYLFCLN